MYLLVEESRQTLCGGLGGGVCHLDLQLGLVGQAVAEEGGRAPAHDAAARAGTCVQLPLRPEPRHRHNYRDVKCCAGAGLLLPLPRPRFTIFVSVP